jgi:hypothetical protein
VAIVGCDENGIRSAGEIGEERLVVVCDKDPRRAASLATTAHACFATNELSEALSFLPDAVIVATPAQFSALIASESLRAGAHVFLCGGESCCQGDLDELYRQAQRARRLFEVEKTAKGIPLTGFLDHVRATRSAA